MEVKTKIAVKSATQTSADQIWSEIKDKKIEMFGLPNQQVHMYCSPISADPDKLFVTTKVGSFLPALETALGTAYTVEQDKLFLIITKNS